MVHILTHNHDDDVKAQNTFKTHKHVNIHGITISMNMLMRRQLIKWRMSYTKLKYIALIAHVASVSSICLTMWIYFIYQYILQATQTHFFLCTCQFLHICMFRLYNIWSINIPLVVKNLMDAITVFGVEKKKHRRISMVVCFHSSYSLHWIPTVTTMMMITENKHFKLHNILIWTDSVRMSKYVHTSTLFVRQLKMLEKIGRWAGMILFPSIQLIFSSNHFGVPSEFLYAYYSSAHYFINYLLLKISFLRGFVSGKIEIKYFWICITLYTFVMSFVELFPHFRPNPIMLNKFTWVLGRWNLVLKNF